jgi:hypothetical protein
MNARDVQFGLPKNPLLHCQTQKYKTYSHITKPVQNEGAMFLTSDFVDFESILDSEGMSEDIMDCCDTVSLSGFGTEAIHDLCKDYTTED